MKNIFFLPAFLCLFILTTCKKRADVFPFPPTPGSMAQIMNQRFQLGIRVSPVVYNEFNEHFVSSVYKEGNLYRAYMDQKGEVTFRAIEPLFPAGELRVFCVVRLSDRLLEQQEVVESLWEEAQRGINQQHRALALSLGLSEPIVRFDTDNFYLSQSEFPEEDPLKNSKDYFRDFARQRQLNLEEYDIFLWMDLDPEHPGGGWGSWEARLAKVNWIYPEDPTLSEENFRGLAYAAYHHEIGHVWGWEHEWSDPYWDLDFITEPGLFGWTDLDGDGIVEILDPDAYQ